MDQPFYFRQLKGGRDIAVGDRVATSMENFVYLLGDRASGEALVVDPAWDIQGIVDLAAADGMKVTGALVTHWHPDHVGGPMFGHDVQGLATLLELNPCPIYVHQADIPWVSMATGVAASELKAVTDGTVVRAGAAEVTCLHTPGHTQGSQCFRCGQLLLGGDTVFIESCGRTDLPGADVEEMWRTLTQRLASLPDEVVLYPGHDYSSVPFAPMERVRQVNAMMGAPSLEHFRALRGG
jgi:hydroxyacylglutathione hydrolase